MTEDAADDDFDDGGDAVSDAEHAATRQILATTMHAFKAVRAVFLIGEFDTRLVKTISGGRATFLGNECGRATPVMLSIRLPTETQGGRKNG